MLQELTRGSVVLVVGSGISIGATGNQPCASWSGLLRNGIERCERDLPLDAQWGDRQRQALDEGDLIEWLGVAEQIERRLKSAGGAFSAWLRDTVGSLQIEYRGVIDAIGKLNVPIVTTNYDSLIEEITCLDPIMPAQPAAEHVVRGACREGVVHLHGCWRFPDTVVLGVSSYEGIMRDERIQALLKALQAVKTLIFVGCGHGLQDPHFDALLKWSQRVFETSEFSHFRLAHEGERAMMEATHPAGSRIKVVYYGRTTNDLEPFLRQLGGGTLDSDDFERLSQDAKARYRTDATQRWKENWFDRSRGDSEDRPPFIGHQTLRLLSPANDPRQLLRLQELRGRWSLDAATRGAGESGPWRTIDRDQLLASVENEHDAFGSDLLRLVITSDAGVGKTTNINWLHAEINSRSPYIAILVDSFAKLSTYLEEVVSQTLSPAFRRVVRRQGHELSPETADRIVEQARDRGFLTLLFDSLDQAPSDGAAVTTLAAMLEDHAWSRCRIVISGRPHALQRHWDSLFSRKEVGWRFLLVNEFTEDQQRDYLETRTEATNRFESVPYGARDVLAAPRVLEYLRKLPTSEFATIRTASDVYWRSIRHILIEGMKSSEAARRIGVVPGERPPDKPPRRAERQLFRLLGAIAFEMTTTLVPDVRPSERGASGARMVANFDRISPNAFEGFKMHLLRRLTGEQRLADLRFLESDLDSLGASEFLVHDIFEPDIEGLDQILWRNRTLQEFFAAYWLAHHCTEDDASHLSARICLAHQPETEEYYWIWRFLCEMPEDARDPDAWERSIGPLYAAGDRTGNGTKRSCEMIYRSWDGLEAAARSGRKSAQNILGGFLGEFANQVLTGHRGVEARSTAERLIAAFIELPAGEYIMGAPHDKQSMPENEWHWWREFLQRDGDPEELAERLISDWCYTPDELGLEEKEADKKWWAEAFRQQDPGRIVQRYYRRNETPAVSLQKIEAFCLHRTSVVNASYRLFVPNHGLDANYYQCTYDAVSPLEQSPVIFVSWYDAWVFCKWLHWDGYSCRLPYENEWEYAAKAGTTWHWNYWWGDEFDEEKCTTDKQTSHTMPPNEEHKNPWGYLDILGNVWEWCQDEYRESYDRSMPPDSSARVLRGGSWHLGAWGTRSAFRLDWLPIRANSYIGFRVARDVGPRGG
jgi:hypothetical protein